MQNGHTRLIQGARALRLGLESLSLESLGLESLGLERQLLQKYNQPAGRWPALKCSEPIREADREKDTVHSQYQSRPCPENRYQPVWHQGSTGTDSRFVFPGPDFFTAIAGR